jgi:pimeloyl-ACP methyl ester carboxylesterase
MTTAHPAGRTETHNGTQIYFEVHGTGEPNLLLHGFSGSSQDWTAAIAEWRTQFQLIVPDLPGHVEKSSPEPGQNLHRAAGVSADARQSQKCRKGISGRTSF